MPAGSKMFAFQRFALGVLLIFFFGIVSPSTALSQTAAQGASASGVLGQFAAALSKGKPIERVHLTGYAKWYAGKIDDVGSADLTASADGSSQVVLQLGTVGKRTETQTGTGTGAVCTWAGSNEMRHAISSDNCWRPSVWFFPAISMRVSQWPQYVGIEDLGDSPVGSNEGHYRHLRSQMVLSGLDSKMMSEIAQESTTDLGLNPNTLLPEVLAYKVRPDDGAATQISIEIRYADYRSIDGVQVPFQIKRYVNGSLQLEIDVNSAEIN